MDTKKLSTLSPRSRLAAKRVAGEAGNSQLSIIIGYLYGDLMNIYGDTGNIIALQKRAKWRGINAKVVNISTKDKLDKGLVDLFFFGGGQDQAQSIVSQDLTKSAKGKVLKSEVERGVPLLAICGGYQLLGDYYLPHKGPRLSGIGLFPVFTIAGDKRMIGNITVKISNFPGLAPRSGAGKFQISNFIDTLVGFENHSGKTYLKEGTEPLGMVIKGYGNNGEDQTEGCVYKNAIGSYMHGPLLPKNPHLADWLIAKALEVKYRKEIKLQCLDDELEGQAHSNAVKRFG